MTTIYKNINLPHPYTLNTTAGYNGTSYTTSSNYVMADGVLNVSGNPAGLEVKGTVVINGRDLEERISTIEKVLQIPQRDVTMESKYPKLKKLYEEYMRELDKLRTWDALKESK